MKRSALLLIAILIFVSGCPRERASSPDKTATITKQVIASVERADSKTEQLSTVIDQTTSENLPEKKPQAKMLTNQIREDLGEAKQQGKLAVDSAVKDRNQIQRQQDQIADLQKDNPLKTYLFWASGGCFSLSVICLIAAFFLPVLRKDLLIASAILFLAGGSFGCIAYYLKAILVVIGAIFGVVILIGLGILGWLFAKWWRAKGIATGIVESFQETGAINTIPKAVAEKVDLIQRRIPGAKKFVDQIQKKVA